MKPLIIRKCLGQDIAPTGAFYDYVVEWLDRNINYPRWIYQVYPSEDYVREMTNAGTQYICQLDDRIAGAFCLNSEVPEGYGKVRWKTELPRGSFQIVHALAADPAIHRQGLGSEMLRFCISSAKSNGFKALRADIVPGNHPAKALFEKNGFVYTGEADLGLSSVGIPFFYLYELNWQKPI